MQQFGEVAGASDDVSICVDQWASKRPGVGEGGLMPFPIRHTKRERLPKQAAARPWRFEINGKSPAKGLARSRRHLHT